MDIETIRKKQRALMARMAERKVRSRARQLYESRDQGEGQDLQDWYQAESEVLENKVLGPLYRRLKATTQKDAAPESASSCETCA